MAANIVNDEQLPNELQTPNQYPLDEIRERYITQLIEKRKWDSQKAIIKSETIRFRQFLDVDNESGDRLKLELLASRLQFARQALAATETNPISSTSTSRKQYISRYLELTNHFHYNGIKALKRLRNLTITRDVYRRGILNDCTQFLSDLELLIQHKSANKVSANNDVSSSVSQEINTTPSYRSLEKRTRGIYKVEVGEMKPITLTKFTTVQTNAQEAVSKHLRRVSNDMESMNTIKTTVAGNTNNNSYNVHNSSRNHINTSAMNTNFTQSFVTKDRINNNSPQHHISTSSSVAEPIAIDDTSAISKHTTPINNEEIRIQLYREHNIHMNANFRQFENDCIQCMNRCTEVTLKSIQQKIALINHSTEMSASNLNSSYNNNNNTSSINNINSSSYNNSNSSSYNNSNTNLQDDGIITYGMINHQRYDEDKGKDTLNTHHLNPILRLQFDNNNNNHHHHHNNGFNFVGTPNQSQQRKDINLRQEFKALMAISLEQDMAAIRAKFGKVVIHTDDDNDNSSTVIDDDDE